MFTLLLGLAPLGAQLSIEGSNPAVAFGETSENRAFLTASCSQPRTGSLSPAVHRMAPTSFMPLAEGDAVTLRLFDVAISCSGLTAATPCAVAFDELDLPRWYCVWSGTGSGEVALGPFHGNVSENLAHAGFPAGAEAPCTAARYS